MEIMKAFWHGLLARRKLFMRERRQWTRQDSPLGKHERVEMTAGVGKLSVKDPGVKFWKEILDITFKLN